MWQVSMWSILLYLCRTADVASICDPSYSISVRDSWHGTYCCDPSYCIYGGQLMWQVSLWSILLYLWGIFYVACIAVVHPTVSVEDGWYGKYRCNPSYSNYGGQLRWQLSLWSTYSISVRDSSCGKYRCDPPTLYLWGTADMASIAVIHLLYICERQLIWQVSLWSTYSISVRTADMASIAVIHPTVYMWGTADVASITVIHPIVYLWGTADVASIAVVHPTLYL